MLRESRRGLVLSAEKEAFRDIEAAATQAHFDRLRTGRSHRVETGALHLVAAAAYPVLKSQGGLLPSRLRLEESPTPTGA